MKLNYALSALLALLDSQRAETRSLLLRQREEKQVNLGIASAVSNKPQTNAVNQMTSSQQLVNVVKKSKSNDIEDVSTPSNRRSLSSSTWNEVASFDQLAESQLGGHGVSMSGDGTFLASAPVLSSSNGFDYNGQVRFYQKHESDGTWEEVTGLRLTGVADGDRFGSGVSLSANGKRVAIGAFSDDGANDDALDSGSVSVYEKNSDGSAWLLMGQVIHGEAAGDESGFGYSVALSKDGSTLAIGAPFNDVNGTKTDSGHVRVYRWDSGTSSFKQLGADIDGEATGERSGYAVALSEDGSVVAIGAPYLYPSALGAALAGQVRVFYWDEDEDDDSNSKWAQRGSPIVGDTAGDELGFCVDLSDDGKIVAAGARDAVDG
eukprot:scaffold5439_cov132-Cylindrotheca_fusiformis.AAC.12